MVKGFSKLVFLSLCSAGVAAAQAEGSELGSGQYPFWGDYTKTLINEIMPAEWQETDGIKDGWDWSLPESVTPAPNAYLCLARNFKLSDTRKIEQLPEVNFPSNPVI